jgi:hypothetical protein
METVTTPEQFNKWAANRKISPINEIEGFKVGDKVTFTNEFGVIFKSFTIIGIDKDNSFYGRQIYLNTDSYWFPHKPSELKHEN